MILSRLFYLHRRDRICVVTLLAIIMVTLSFGYTVDLDKEIQQPMASALVVAASDSASSAYYAQPQHPAERFAFDPNTADSTQLLRLGLPSWMVHHIYRYRASGGVYRTKEDFAQTYGLTAKQYQELAPYIHISADYQPASQLVARESAPERDALQRPQKLAPGQTIDLNAADTTVYQQVPGIGSYYARRIETYRARLGGFVSIDQLDEIDGFPQEAKTYFSISEATPQQLRVNHLSPQELRRHPYISDAQARAIADYRRLHGKIRSLDDLGLLDIFSPAAIRRLQPYINYN